MVDNDGDAAWEHIVREYDQYSLYEFLRFKGWSRGAIEYFTVINFLEADMHNSLVEILREDLGGAYVDMQEIAGGMDGLPNAFYAEVKDEVRFGANVFAIDQDPDGVTVHFKTESGRFSERADHIIVTIPFPVLRTVEVIKPFSAAKQRAIRQLNYHASTKILFQVRNRFWEEEDGIYGGGTVTELPIRRMNYPTPDPTTTRGVLLASYTWGQDALQWGAMDEETRLEEALDDVARIHPRIREEYEVGASYAWYADRWARGAFAMFAPEQQTDLQADIVRVRGPDPLRRRALLAVSRLDPGRPRIGDPRRADDPRGAGRVGASPAPSPPCTARRRQQCASARAWRPASSDGFEHRPSVDGAGSITEPHTGDVRRGSGGQIGRRAGRGRRSRAGRGARSRRPPLLLGPTGISLRMPGVDGVGVLGRGRDGALDPAPAALVAGVVGEPDPADRSDDVVVELAGQLHRPEERPDPAGVRVERPVVRHAELERRRRLGMDLDQVLERLRRRGRPRTAWSRPCCPAPRHRTR